MRQQHAIHAEVKPTRIVGEQLPSEQIVQVNYEADPRVLPMAPQLAQTS